MVNILDRLIGKKVKKKKSPLPGSIRQFCFSCFNEGKRPMQVLRENPDLNKKTLFVYHGQWKKLSKLGRDPIGNKRHLHRLARDAHDPVYRSTIVNGFAKKYHMTPEEVEEFLRQPWGVKRLLSGKAQTQFDMFRKIRWLNKAVEIIKHCEHNGLSADLVFEKALELEMKVQGIRYGYERTDQQAMTPTEQRAYDEYLKEQAVAWATRENQAVLDICEASKTGNDSALKNDFQGR